jgi:hypothetical protein
VARLPGPAGTIRLPDLSRFPLADGERAQAKGIVERWNEQIAASHDMLWSPTIRAALIGALWLDVFCTGCGTSRAIELRKVDRHLGRDGHLLRTIDIQVASDQDATSQPRVDFLTIALLCAYCSGSLANSSAMRLASSAVRTSPSGCTAFPSSHE